MDDWQTFLARIEQTIAAQTAATASKSEIFGAESGKNSQPSHHQQTSTRNEPGMNPEQPGIARNETGNPRNDDGITRNDSGTIGIDACSFPPVNNPQANPDQKSGAPKSESPNPQSASANSKSDAPNPRSEDPQLEIPDPKFPAIDPRSAISNPTSENPQSPIPDPRSEDFEEAAADLPFRLKGRSRFDQLTTEQQDAIMALLETYKYTTVLELIAQPPPLGLSFKIGKSALFEFKARYRQRQAERRKKESADRAIELLNKSENPGATFMNLYERLLQIKALGVASNSDATLAQLDEVTATITKLRKQSLAERKQRHAEGNDL
jgi:hypothetical protein